MKAKPVVLITGGAGFLGRFLVRELQRQTEGLVPREIRVFDINRGGFDDADRVVEIAGDIRSPAELAEAFRGVDVVFHCAAIVDWGHHPEKVVREVNLTGTENVIRASRTAQVRVLVHTSSEDAVLSGEPIRNADENLPYPESFASAYCETKARSEQAVLGANEERLRTVVLRPGGMYGEGDPYHVGSLLKMAKRGMLFRIGDGSARCQHVYVGNVAHAHVLAALALLEGRREVAGQVYFVTDSPPRNFFDFLGPIVEGAGYRMRPRALSLPRSLMFGLGAAVEAAAWLLRPVFPFTPLVSRFGVNYVCQDFTFSSDKAGRDFGYRPVVSEEEAVRRTIAHFREHDPA